METSYSHRVCMWVQHRSFYVLLLTSASSSVSLSEELICLSDSESVYVYFGLWGFSVTVNTVAILPYESQYGI